MVYKLNGYDYQRLIMDIHGPSYKWLINCCQMSITISGQ